MLDFAGMWHKFYPLKGECVNDLGRLGLLTIMDQDDVLSSDFDTKDRVLTIVTSTEEDLFTEAVFVKITPTNLN